MKSEDLHGNAPDHSEIALILTDVINDFEFEGVTSSFAVRCRQQTISRV
jgi:hypothetical protein